MQQQLIDFLNNATDIELFVLFGCLATFFSFAVYSIIKLWPSEKDKY